MKPNPIAEDVFRAVCSDLSPAADARSADDPSWRIRRVEVAQIAAKLPERGVFLDVGCGYGFVPRYFHRLGFKVISTDYPATGGASLQALIDLGIEGHYVNVGREPLPLADGSVDVAFAGNVIEHLPHSPRPFMEDLRRVLKPGGFLVMDTKNAVDLKTRLKVLCGVHNWAPLKSFYHLDINPHHHKEYTLRELGQLFELAGFGNVERIAFEFFFHFSLRKFRGVQAMGAKAGEHSEFGAGFNPWHPYEYLRLVCLLLTRLFPGLRSEIMVVGQKPVR